MGSETAGRQRCGGDLFIGGSDSYSEYAAAETVRRYVELINIYSRMGILETWYARIDENEILAICPPELR